MVHNRWVFALNTHHRVDSRLSTGTSSGFGREPVYIALARGDKVIATARSLEKIEDFPKSDAIRLMVLDVTEGLENIKRKVKEAVTWFGRIDVLVNNAGVSVKATVEEGGYDFSYVSWKMFAN